MNAFKHLKNVRITFIYSFLLIFLLVPFFSYSEQIDGVEVENPGILPGYDKTATIEFCYWEDFDKQWKIFRAEGEKLILYYNDEKNTYAFSLGGVVTEPNKMLIPSKTNWLHYSGDVELDSSFAWHPYIGGYVPPGEPGEYPNPPKTLIQDLAGMGEQVSRVILLIASSGVLILCFLILPMLLKKLLKKFLIS